MTTRVLVAPLSRERGMAVALVATPPQPERVPFRRPARAARTLALAHHIRRAMDAGALADGADAARRLGLTRARVSQLLDLLLLAPDIQEAVLHAEALDGREPFTERELRPIASVTVWSVQRDAWRSLQAPRKKFRRS